ncbi:phosphate signaling complex protein PhoU [candidate division WOR-3 bacterium]|nr:phosphate signaling complex protein PhoU [candidate division WOR-3 bacterium]
MTLLETKIAELKAQLLTMAAIVEEMVSNSIKSLVSKDKALAEQVIRTDEVRVNQLEIENEDSAINLMALYQPEASNLRTIAMVIKLNNDLERIGDHAENIAEAALFLIDKPPVKPLIDLPRMAEIAISMLKDSLDAFTHADAELARSVCTRDSAVDELNRAIKAELMEHMSRDPSTIERAMKLLMISLNLERVADLATNIAEDVIYIVTGEDIKHGQAEQPSR